ncbi:MAG: succinate dehydrogenase [Oscillospiraceae bacterium]|nr:succinate dehydrogenase [Oscillospiraceae bacterium]
MKTLLKILVVPVTLMISLLVRLCAGLISHTVLLFQIASTVLGLLALAVLLTSSVANGLILLGIALAVSPIGIPMLAAKLLGALQSIKLSLQGFLHS